MLFEMVVWTKYMCELKLPKVQTEKKPMWVDLTKAVVNTLAI